MKLDKEAMLESAYKQPKNYKKKYKVILVAPTYIVYEDDGNTKFINGKFDVKIGDSIELPNSK